MRARYSASRAREMRRSPLLVSAVATSALNAGSPNAFHHSRSTIPAPVPGAAGPRHAAGVCSVTGGAGGTVAAHPDTSASNAALLHKARLVAAQFMAGFPQP